MGRPLGAHGLLDVYPLKIDSQAGHIHLRPGLTLYPGMGRIGYLLFCLRCLRRKEPGWDWRRCESPSLQRAFRVNTGGQEALVDLHFGGTGLEMAEVALSLPHDKPDWGIWCGTDEDQRKALHDRFLLDHRVVADNPWGAAASNYDPRNRGSHIAIVYTVYPSQIQRPMFSWHFRVVGAILLAAFLAGGDIWAWLVLGFAGALLVFGRRWFEVDRAKQTLTLWWGVPLLPLFRKTHPLERFSAVRVERVESGPVGGSPVSWFAVTLRGYKDLWLYSDDLPGAQNRAIHFAATFGKLAGMPVEYSLGHGTND